MASVAVSGKAKATSSGARGMMMHDYRVHEHHSNTDIDASKSNRNIFFGCNDFQQASDLFKRTLEQLDKEHPPKRVRADRKVFLNPVITAPREDMSSDDTWMFFVMVYNRFSERYKTIYGAVHMDEIHTYKSEGEEHTSRAHMHIGLIPWTEEKGVNMDSFYHRTLPNEMNEICNEVCRELFGYDYEDGTKKKSRGTVEKLKTQEAIENRKAAEAELNDLLIKGQATLDKQAEQIKDKKDEKGALEAHIAHLTELSKGFTTEAEKAREEADKAVKVRNAINEQIRRDGFVGSDMSVLTLLALLREDGRDELADGLQYLIEQEYSL